MVLSCYLQDVYYERTNVSNYRPVSVLKIFLKICEWAYYRHIYSYLSHNKILIDNQYGFRQAHSTNLALASMVSSVFQAWEQRQFMVAILLDLSKADHKILITKLQKYGIQGPALNWLKSYLSIDLRQRRSMVLSYRACPSCAGFRRGPSWVLCYS